MVKKSTVLWLSCIMLLGAVFRLSIYNMEPLFYDAAYYASLGRSIAEGDYLLQVNQMSDKPPLFFYIQAVLFYLFGIFESVALLPSFVGGMLGIGILYFLGKDLYNSVAGILAALLYAMSPGSVLLSAVGFIDSLFMAFVLFSFWTLLHRRYYWTGFNWNIFRAEANCSVLRSALSHLVVNTGVSSSFRKRYFSLHSKIGC